MCSWTQNPSRVQRVAINRFRARREEGVPRVVFHHRSAEVKRREERESPFLLAELYLLPRQSRSACDSETVHSSTYREVRPLRHNTPEIYKSCDRPVRSGVSEKENRKAPRCAR